MSNLFENLNDKQREAVMATEGKVRVVAGAGSGKTRVLTHRYAFLVNEVGVDPGNILCLTFTNKAAREMKNRIAKLVNREHVNDFTCTIHGFCVKFLRREIHRIGYPKTFTIIDEEDAKALAMQVFEEMHIDTTKDTIKNFLSDVTGYKASIGYVSNLIIPEANIEASEVDEIVRYIQLQKKNFAIDFNDIINFALYIMERYPDALTYWQDKMNYVQVDEVQDCNAKDWQIINYMSEGYGNLFVVGDSDQAIYEWRGARPSLFNTFEPDTDIILNQNYRSTPNILAVANSIIAHNVDRIPKELFTLRPSDKVVVHHHAKSEKDECKWIADQIQEMSKNGIAYNSFAILYRASFLSRNIEQELIKKQIKYVVWGGLRFFERKEIKDCLAYLRLIANKNDDIAFRRIINVPLRKFGKTSQAKLQTLADEDGLSLYDALVKHKDEEPFVSKKQIMDFLQFIDDCHGYSSFTAIGELLDFVLQHSGLEKMYRTDGDEERLENIAELKQSIKEFENQNTESEFSSLESYLQEVALYTNADYKDDGETVKLMTIHQAKGLEFPYVFIIGLSEGIFPNYRSIREGKKAAEEEERRLMYVAVTRAENGLFLTESEGYNFMTRQEKFPSRYILEVSEGLLHLDGEIDKELMNNLLAGTKRQMEELSFETNPLSFNVGDKVSHKIFGEGEIIGKQNESSYRVRFEKGERFIQSNFLKKIESVATEGKKLKVGFVINDSELGKGRIIEVFDVPGNESAIVEFESGVKRWVEEKQGKIIVLSDMYEIPEPEEPEPQRPTPAEGLQVGSVINHQRFGRGVVTSIFGEGDQAKMMVDFDKEGTKQLLIKFTKFEFV